MTTRVISATDINRSVLFKTWVGSDIFETLEEAGFEIIDFLVENGAVKIAVRHQNGKTYVGRVMANISIFSKRLRMFAVIDATEDIPFPGKSYPLRETEVFLEPQQ